MAPSEPPAPSSFACPVEVPMTVLGGKWKRVLIFHLLQGPKRNGELLRLVPGVTQKMLTEQLRELERDGIVVRSVHEQVPPKVVYSLCRPARPINWRRCSKRCAFGAGTGPNKSVLRSTSERPNPADRRRVAPVPSTFSPL